MNVFGFDVSRKKAASPGRMSGVDTRGGWLNVIREGFTGAWQRNIEVEPPENILKFSAVYACVTLISDDISKLRIKLMLQENGIWTETTDPRYSPVLRKPNRYQTRIQFLSNWLISKLLYGNTYILKERNSAGTVVAMYVLDPRRVSVLVSEDGDVFYRLQNDLLAGTNGEGLPVPAAEIIHDRCGAFFHPLVGVSPIYACGMSATQGMRIQNNSAVFFENMSRPSGILTAPGRIDPDTAATMKTQWDQNFAGGNSGKVAVLGDGLKYEGMTIPSRDAQLIEQLRWTVEDVSRCFHIPSYKLNNGAETLSNVGARNQEYYTQTLQVLIEQIELLLDEALGLTDSKQQTLGTELDLDGLLRMDPLSRAETAKILVGAGIKSPNESRFGENLAPVKGGDSPMIQQQNFSLSALAKRDALPNPFVIDQPATTPTPAEPVQAPQPAAKPPEGSAKDLSVELIKRFSLEPACV